MTNNSTTDPRYFHGGGQGWMEENSTPRTDAAFGQGKHGVMKIPYETSCKLESELKASKAEVERLSKLTEDCLNVIRVYCPTYYQDAMERFKQTNK